MNMFDFDPKEVVRGELKAASTAENIERHFNHRDSMLSDELSLKARTIASSVQARPLSPAVICGLVRMYEWLVVVSVCYLAFLPFQSLELDFQGLHASVTLTLSLLILALFEGLHLYRIPRMRLGEDQAIRLFSGWSLAFMILSGLIVILDQARVLQWQWLIMCYAGGLIAISSSRIVLRHFLIVWTEQGRLAKRAVLVGGGPAAEELISALLENDMTDIHLCGVFDDRDDDRSPESLSGCPKLGTVDNLVAFSRAARIDTIIMTLPITAEKRLLEIIKKLSILPVDIRLSAYSSKIKLRPRVYSYIGKVPFFDLFDKPIADWNIVSKWLFDRIVGTLILIAAAPLMVMIALAIKATSKGPVFFCQERHGFNNELIKVYKFRSMFTDQCDSRANKLVTKNDPRVTPVGRFIRKTSLDELPQLFNVVFFGNLSLVGPRPHALSAKANGGLYKDVVDGYFARHKVKPGITGWAQINGWRGETDTQEKIQKRVEHDLFYIENWSIWLDLKILALTPIALFNDSENAY
jgi:Undecaprenyl-phosphate glucose phosphotransferase